MSVIDPMKVPTMGLRMIGGVQPMNRRDTFAKYHHSMAAFSRDVIGMPLHPYQVKPADCIAQLVANRETAEVTVEMSRQSGKNEMSAHIEAAILARYARRGGIVVKAAPTWRPQIVRSKSRLEQRARDVRRRLSFLKFNPREGYIFECGDAAINFLSGRPTANVVGDTASLLLEIDEAQDFDTEKYDKEFAPMRASTGAPAVFYGTTWTDTTLLDRTKRAIQEGRVKGFVYRIPWDVVAEDNPAYGRFVEGEIERLGIDHPLIKTQYRLEPLAERGRLFTSQQLRQMIGSHPPAQHRIDQRLIVAGLDFAGADEQADEMISTSTMSGRDSVALTIGEVEFLVVVTGIALPLVKVLARYEWVNVSPTTMHTTLFKILNNDWQVDRVHCDATGIGETPTSLLATAMNKPGHEPRVIPIKFDGHWNAHSRMTFQYISAVNGSRFLEYQQPGIEPVVEAERKHPPGPDQVERHVWWQRGHARLETKPGKRVKVYVPENEGHDDLIYGDLLALDAAHQLGTPNEMQSTSVDWYGQVLVPVDDEQTTRSDAEIAAIMESI
ncbi:MAG: hypothetical protein AAF485_05755 [Chloroflexota bacterium]